MDTNMQDTASAGPVAERRPHVSVSHGVTRVDDYAWLRVDNWREVMQNPKSLDPAVRAYLEAENAYAAAKMAPTEGLQAKLFEEMKGRLKEDDETPPAPYGPWAYFVSYVTGGQHPLFCRVPRDGGEKQILLDGNAMAAGHAYYRIASRAPSPDHKLIAYAYDDMGSEYYTVRVRDLASGADLLDEINNTDGDVVWSEDGRFLFYTRLDDNHRPLKVFRHRLGASPEEDVLVYAEPDAGYYVSLAKTQSRRYIVIRTGDHQTTEIHLIDSEEPESAPRMVAPRLRGHEYYADHHGDKLIILTNSDGAEDFRIMEAPVAAPGRQHWREIEHHRPGRLILDVAAYEGHLVRLEREDGLPRIVIRRFRDGAEHAVAFDEAAYSLSFSPGYEFDARTVRFTYSSMTTPAQVFDYDMETRERVLRKSQEVPSGHNPEDYVSERLTAPAPDGELVPVSILRRKSTPLDGSAPVLLYGYGAYGLAIPAAFSTERLSLVDRGFIFAIAHVRGGKDKGCRWYRLGRRELKTNTFTDFIAAGEHLAKQGLTTRGGIVAQGGSAGGMLMGAVANMAPDLFGAIIAEVPFVDVLATMLDDSLPLTPPEWPEWGNPILSKEDYQTIAAYSPYDNVRAQAYPNILVLAGLTDPRVTYWEPAKWTAKLRALKTDGNLLLLRTNMEAGHGGASGRFDRLKEVALSYAFALLAMGKAGE
jgi:oligopeptidase B